jgi:hypothetical protein
MVSVWKKMVSVQTDAYFLDENEFTFFLFIFCKDEP